VDDELLESVCDDFCASAEIGIRANNVKAPYLNWSSRFLLASVFCLIVSANGKLCFTWRADTSCSAT
jgi:hypothetical protein